MKMFLINVAAFIFGATVVGYINIIVELAIIRKSCYRLTSDHRLVKPYSTKQVVSIALSGLIPIYQFVIYARLIDDKNTMIKYTKEGD